MSALSRRLILWLLAVAVFAPAVRGQEAFYKTVVDLKAIDYRTDWYGVYLQDRKVGYMRGERTRLEDGAVREAELISLKLVSFGQKAEMTMEQEFVYDGQPPYRLRSARYASSDGKAKQTVTVRRADKGYEFTHEAPGVRQVKAQPDLEYGLADALAVEAWLRQGPKVADAIRYRQLEPSEGKIDELTSRVVSAKTSLVGGVDVRFYELETLSKEKGIKALSRHDATGLMLSDQVAVFELRLEPADKAKNIEYSQDLFVMGLVKIDRGLGDPRQVRGLVVEVSGKGDVVFEDGPRQSLAPAEGTKGGQLLKLGKAYGKPARATDKEIREALEETPTYPLSHPKVKELARQAVGDARTPEEKVKRLVAFVHRYVQPHLSGNIPQVHDLIESKKGDCKSYALLFTNLARAAGVPAREVSGLLYVGDDTKAFGGHAWNEVVLDGAWVPIDASIGETEVNATHVSFGSEGRATANLLNSLGKLSFRLVDVQRAR